VTERCRQPQRCVIGHPFNPPHLIPLVEVVGGAKTSPAAIQRAMDFYRGIGKHPIHIKKEVRGHVANRLQAALWREAIHLVVERWSRSLMPMPRSPMVPACAGR
jgi:carnitine 3-dehydrogenase